MTASERVSDDHQVLSETEALLRSLQGVWDEEAVDDLDHGLQAATRAIEDGADDELVLAAALHDLAHSPLCDSPNRGRHDLAAREWLTPRYGVRVGWLAGAHVAAKRYLVAPEPGYGEGLSSTSVLSLAAQGGPAEDEGMVSNPWWPDALRLRHYDDAAKVPGAPVMSIEDVLAVAQRVLRQNNSQ